MSIRKQVLIVDDHEQIALALSMLLNRDPRFQICGVARDIPEAATMMPEARADLVIADLRLAGGSGLDLIPTLRYINPAARYLIFSQEEPAVAGPSVRTAGASGYLQKGASTQRFGKVFRTSHPSTESGP